VRKTRSVASAAALRCLMRSAGPWPDNVPPKLLKDSAFRWWLTTWRYSLKKMASSHGLDAAASALYLRTVLQIFVASTAYAMIVLVPVQLTSPRSVTDSEGNDSPRPGLLALSLDNIANGSALLIFHVVGAWLYSFVAMYGFYRAYRKYANMRVAVMLRHTPANYTIIVRELPSETDDGKVFDDKALLELFEFMFPGEIVAAHVAPHTPKVDKLRDERQQAARKLEHAMAEIGVDPYGERIGDVVKPKEPIERPKVRVGGHVFNLFGGEKKDAIAHWRAEVLRLGQAIAGVLVIERLNYTATGFVTFKKISRAYAAQQVTGGSVCVSFVSLSLVRYCWSAARGSSSCRRRRRLLTCSGGSTASARWYAQ
jgi:hypothetical protein